MNSLFQTVTASETDDNVVALPSGQSAVQKVLIKDLELQMSIGVYDSEKQAKQRVLVNAEIAVKPNPNWQDDNIDDVVSYADIIESIHEISQQGHIHLVETFAEKIIESCFSHGSVLGVSVSVKKPDILAQAGSVGVSISKYK